MELKKVDGLNMYKQTTFIEKTDEGATDGMITTATSIQPYRTYWKKDYSYMQGAFKKNDYCNLLLKTSGDYWLASRAVENHSLNTASYFTVYFVSSGNINAYGMFASDTSTGNGTMGLFPVVSLRFNLISGNATNGFTVNVN